MTSSNGNIFRVTGRWPVNSPHKGQWRGALMFSLICACVNGWVNTRAAGDLRHHRAHYDVIVISIFGRGICSSKRFPSETLAKPRLLITYYSVAFPFWDFAQSMVVILPCSVLNFKTIKWLKWMIRTNEFSRYLNLGYVSPKFHIATTPWFRLVPVAAALRAHWLPLPMW